MKTLVKQLLVLGLIAYGFYLFTAYPRLREVETGKTPEYPELQPHDYGFPVDQVTAGVKKVMGDLGRWEIVGEGKGPEGARIQAVHRHALLPLRDDVVVSIRREKGRSVVNVRSKARLDAPDLGRQARAIGDLLYALDREVF